MFRFGDELFFSGRASCAATAEDGRQRAYESAVQEVLNYTQLPRLLGVPIETQMLFEEPNSAGCPSGTVSVWRLLRISELTLDTLAQRTHRLPRVSQPKADPILQPVRDLTLRVGMKREEIQERFGLPRAVIMRRSSREVQYDYTRLGSRSRWMKTGNWSAGDWMPHNPRRLHKRPGRLAPAAEGGGAKNYPQPGTASGSDGSFART